MEKKICSKCKVEKDVCEFYKKNKYSNLYRGQCKKCMDTNSSTYKKNNAEIISEKSKKFRKENPEINKEKCRIYREKNPETFKKWLEKNKEHRRTYINNYNLNPKNKKIYLNRKITERILWKKRFVVSVKKKKNFAILVFVIQIKMV